LERTGRTIRTDHFHPKTKAEPNSNVSKSSEQPFMPESPACPTCKATVIEKTLVEWDAVIEVGITQ
jgi:hypothetical protein